MFLASVTMKTVYKELKSLKKDIEIVKYALIPKEEISLDELKEIKKIKKKMESGKEKSFEEVFSC